MHLEPDFRGIPCFLERNQDSARTLILGVERTSNKILYLLHQGKGSGMGSIVTENPHMPPVESCCGPL
ncbi:hypothetical protein TNCV_5019911 [Trichonephila clavipes]|nr:hypothetical protein TNCV_5019911 [Trichonephila clavipes]